MCILGSGRQYFRVRPIIFSSKSTSNVTFIVRNKRLLTIINNTTSFRFLLQASSSHISFHFRLISVVRRFIVITMTRLRLLTSDKVPTMSRTKRPRILLFLAMTFITNRSGRILTRAIISNIPSQSNVTSATISRQSAVSVHRQAGRQGHTKNAASVSRTIYVLLLLRVFNFAHRTVTNSRSRTIQQLRVHLMIRQVVFFQVGVGGMFRISVSPPPRRVPRASVVVFFRRISVTRAKAPTLPKNVQGAITHPNKRASHVERPGIVVRGTIRRSSNRSNARPSSFGRRAYTAICVRVYLPWGW